MQQTFNCLDGLYLYEKSLLVDTIIRNQPRKQSAEEVERLNRKKRTETKIWKVRSSLLKKGCFVNKTIRTSQTTSNTYNSDFNADTPLLSEASSSEDEDIGMCKGMSVKTYGAIGGSVDVKNVVTN